MNKKEIVCPKCKNRENGCFYCEGKGYIKLNNSKEKFMDRFNTLEALTEFGGYDFSIEKCTETIWDWINQNYISKEEILNLECLEEEWEGPNLDFDGIVRNQLRKEIKEAINNLK